MKRLFDIVFSITGIFILLPFFAIIGVFILSESKGSIFYKQLRVGKNSKDFYIYKFRTMVVGADKEGLLTIGNNDKRITKTGYFLRKYKIDELPQLFNVLLGTMRGVGPRPEVRKYVNGYTTEEKKILTIKPGITDYASIEYSNENELLANSTDPEKTYVHEIMPAKLKLNINYLKTQNMLTDVKIILKTLLKITSKV